MSDAEAARRPRLFGTDGIRARFGEPPLDAGTVRRIGVALAAALGGDGPGPKVLLGRDTRTSGLQLLDWIARGLAAGGARATDVGVLPTSGIARLVSEEGAAAGVSLSASHNPPEDNGIKLIDARGFKWSETAEAALEDRVESTPDPGPGEAARELDVRAAERYFARLRGLAGDAAELGGTKIALDAAHGAASALARRLFESTGALVESIHDQADGTRINQGCGATHPAELAGYVRAHGFDFGFAFDGDADRAILVDELGGARDGDAMLYLWARDLGRRDELPRRSIVATSMSNLGLETALARDGIAVVRCGVGDREVVDTLRREGLRLGGEPSGHLVDLRLSTTGDGLLTALVVARLLAESGLRASEALAGFRRYPQLIRNVRVGSRPALEGLPAVAAAAQRARERLGADGRLVLRYSGTEPLARIMLEGPDEETIENLAAEIAAAIEQQIGDRR